MRAAAAGYYSAGIKIKPTVYVELSGQFWTAGNASFISDVIKKAGGHNIFSDVKTPYFQTAWETVINRNPDIIISFSSHKAEITKRQGASALTAVRNSAIIDDLNVDVFSRPSPKITESIKELSRRLKNTRR